MLANMGLSSSGVRCSDGTFIGSQRHFGIDDDVLAVGQVDDDIGPLDSAVGTAQTRLRLELVSIAQPRRLEDALEDDFTPATLEFVVAFEGVG